jgi:hypothetical protein
MLAGDIGTVTCATTSLCIVGAALGNVYTSSNPTGGSSAWTETRLAAGNFPFGPTVVSCGSTHLCAAYFGSSGPSGEVAITSEPLGGASAWTVRALATQSITSLSCAGDRTCAAESTDGQLRISVAAADPAAVWTAERIAQGYNAFEGIVCPSASLCVGYDNAGNVITSGHPPSGARTWHVTHVDAAPVATLACPSVRLCVGVDTIGHVISSLDPTGGRAAWKVGPVPGFAAGSVISCASVTFCVGTSGADVITSEHPAAGAGGLRPRSTTGPSRAGATTRRSQPSAPGRW